MPEIMGDSRMPKLNSIESLRIRQMKAEQSVDKATKLKYASYRGRKNSNLKGPSPDYQGPLVDGGQGTRDRMPGTTPTWKPEVRRQYAGPPKPKNKKRFYPGLTNYGNNNIV